MRRFKAAAANMVMYACTYIYNHAWEVYIANTDYIKVGGTDD